jgi:hypothetical protein
MNGKKPTQPAQGAIPMHKKLAMGQMPKEAKPVGKKTCD